MKHSKTVALLLAALISVSALFSCGSKDTPDEAQSTDSSSSEVTTGEFTPEVLDLGGKEVQLLLWSDTQMALDAETGDVIDDAVYRRNSKIESLYNFEFKFDVRDCPHTPDGNATWYSVLQSSILADDDAYQLAGGYSYQLAKSSLNGELHNLNANPCIDFSKPWWPSNIMEVGNIGGNMYLTYGNMDPLYYDYAYGIFFNKRIAADLNMESIYDLVDSGKWTFDKMTELSASATFDLNGDSKIDEKDRFGYITNHNMGTDAYIQACDIQITKMSSDNTPELIGLSERYVSVYEKLKSFFKESGNCLYGADNEGNYVKLFMSGQGMFYADKIGNAHALRVMDDDFGIIPYPKYDEAQEKYITYNALGDTTGFCIPITADEKESGAILEAMAYYGWSEVRPEYFERALKVKAARDNESAAMLELIYDNIEFEFTQIYSSCFGDQNAPSMMLRMSLKNDNEISSMWASNENLFDETMKTLIETLE